MRALHGELPCQRVASFWRGLVAGEAARLAVAAIWDHVLQAGAVAGTAMGLADLRCLGLAMWHGRGMATGAGAGEECWDIERVTLEESGSEGGRGVGVVWGLAEGFTLGASVGCTIGALAG